MNNKIAVILVLANVKYSLNDLEKHYKTFCGLYLVAFSVVLKKQLNLHLTYFVETLYSASPQTNKKALIPLGIRAFPNFAFLRSGAYGTRTRDPMRDRHVF